MGGTGIGIAAFWELNYENHGRYIFYVGMMSLERLGRKCER